MNLSISRPTSCRDVSLGVVQKDLGIKDDTTWKQNMFLNGSFSHNDNFENSLSLLLSYLTFSKFSSNVYHYERITLSNNIIDSYDSFKMMTNVDINQVTKIYLMFVLINNRTFFL